MPHPAQKRLHIEAKPSALPKFGAPALKEGASIFFLSFRPIRRFGVSDYLLKVALS